MKIKWDFVTNSSSTAYIVTIPKKFNVTDVHSILEDTMNYVDEKEHYCEGDDMQFFEYFSINIEKLKEGQIVWNNEDPCFWSTMDYLEKKGLVITHFDTPSDGMDTLQPVKFDHLKQCIEEIEGQL